MSVHVIRVPDIGEGIAETEIVEWLVKPGDSIAEDQIVVSIMTDKATVEVPSPVAGRVVFCAAKAGETLAVGAELIRLEVAGEGNLGKEAQKPLEKTESKPDPASIPVSGPKSAPTDPPLAAPAVRALAREKGIDLWRVTGSGPGGRVLREDIERFDPLVVAGSRLNLSVEEVSVIGLRKRISQRMEEANRIPQITIVEEVDVSACEALRQRLNERAKTQADAVKLTLLPFIVRAIVQAVADQPTINAHYDAKAGQVRRFGAVHVGIATQTPQGLVVPVLRHAEALGLKDAAASIARLAQAARNGRATHEELSGSTITLTSLGALGALATTPILNPPEVAIVGVNRMAVRPFWNGLSFEPRKMMNLSCSFDHRIVDGWDGAIFVQKIKELLETPALLFVEA